MLTVYVHGQELRLLLFICSLFCERVAFIFDIMLLGVQRCVRGDDGTRSYFDGPTDWNATSWWEKRELAPTTISTILLLSTFLLFFCQAARNHPVIDSPLRVR